MPDKKAQCRFYTRHANRCTGEAVDPAGEILICQRHLAYAMELLTAQGFRILPPEPLVCPRCEREVCGCPSLDQVRFMRGDKEYIR